MYKSIKKCRICGNDNLVVVMDLGIQTLTGVFPKSIDEVVGSGPVELVKCVGTKYCGLVQLRQSYDISEMYGDNYGYRSGLNASMVEHLRSKVKKILNEFELDADDLIIDIGSNDGTTLKEYPQGIYQLVGIDPTGEKFRGHYREDISLVADFFASSIVDNLNLGRKAKVITSFSMFYDLEDPILFASEIADSLEENGVWIFEQSYLPAMLEATSFDTICHEHLEFYSFKQIEWILDKAGLIAVDVEFNDVNGGSFSITAAKKHAKIVINSVKLDEVRRNEIEIGVEDIAKFEGFKDRVDDAREALMNFLRQARSEGKKVSGLGASTKGNVLLQYFGITPDLLAEIGEVNEEKFGSLTPGTGIPLKAESEVLDSNPDYLLVLPWHFRAFFESSPKMKGRTLVFPLPKFEISKVG